MEWLFVGVGILFILLGIVIFFGGTEKGDRLKIFKRDSIEVCKSLGKSLAAIAIISVPLTLMTKGELGYAEVLIALSFLVLFYSGMRDVINFIVYNFKFFTKKKAN